MIFCSKQRNVYLNVLVCFVAVAIINAAFPVYSTYADTVQSIALSPDEIQKQLNDKSKQLEQINKQLSETRQGLQDTQRQKTSLQQELNGLQKNIKQLTLGIQLDSVSQDKLRLEVSQLQDQMNSTLESINNKQESVAQVLRELGKGENDSFLLAFLKNDTLADSVSDAQTLVSLQNQLRSDIDSLKNLSQAYQTQVNSATQKKDQIAYHQKNLQEKKLIVDDQKQERQQLLTETKNKESLFKDQMAKLEVQQQSIADEVEKLDAALRAKIDPTALPKAAKGVLGYPIESGYAAITQGYGSTSFAKYGYKGKWHNGLDFGAPIGTPILAAEDGRVVAAGNQDAYCYKGAYGRFVVLDHSNNLTTLYGHMSRFVVAVGETIKRGQVIGYVGKTGYATGPHLHFTVYDQKTFYMGPSKTCGQMPYGGDLNPASYL